MRHGIKGGVGWHDATWREPDPSELDIIPCRFLRVRVNRLLTPQPFADKAAIEVCAGYKGTSLWVGFGGSFAFRYH